MKEGKPQSSSAFFKTDGGKTKSNAIEIPSISLPRGGGAIKGIDEKFTVNSVNGTASFSVPLPVSPTRGSVSPNLNLTYNSGSGNGIFGLGWSFSLPSIKLKTDKEIPQYLGGDTFQFSEAEDLVPEFAKDTNGRFSIDNDGKYIIKEKDTPDGLFIIRYYRPRIEGLFARIERWTGKQSHEVKWRVISKDNLTTLFGWSANSTISNPKDNSQIFEWLPEFIFDDKGNCAHYVYKKEDNCGFDDSVNLHNRNRTENGQIVYVNRYLEKVLYGNKTPFKQLHDAFPNETDYMFQTVFDYGEYDANVPYKKIKDWDFRKDAFSDYKAGFEIRTTRLCKRVLLFHYFAELQGGSALVKSLNFGYDTGSEANFTYLTSITANGYIKKPDGSYSNKQMPAVEFSYQKLDWSNEVKSLSSDALIHAPAGLDEPHYQFVDLYNEGLAGILTEAGGCWWYKRNLGNGHFGQAVQVSQKPSYKGLGSQLQLMDLDADGSKQLVNMNGNLGGYFELCEQEEGGHSFRTFTSLPQIPMGDPNVRFIDLNGDGRPDILISEDHVFTWYESAGRKGYENRHQIIKPNDEENGPCLIFADLEQTIFLADMSGDGMSDIVRIRNGEICYWPNLGYGRFGAKVSMDNAPRLDHFGSFNPSYVRLTDIDGSGTSDLIYLGQNKFSCWKNSSGNAFSAVPFEIEAFPEIHPQANVTVADLLGNGVACIVWSSPLSKNAQSPLKYIDLMNGRKPHVMVSYKNNLGKEVSIEYGPSTRYYMEDELMQSPWATKLHFPVHVIVKTETRDLVTGFRQVCSFRYKHGYYDHEVREFRGFGMVEQTDTEYFEHWVKGEASNIVDNALHQNPVITRNWFHTGAFQSLENVLHPFSSDYWYEQMARAGFKVANKEASLPDMRIIASSGLDPISAIHLGAEEWREALRACKSMSLRSETFAYDAPLSGATSDQIQKQLTPYTVASHNYVIELLQPRGQNKHAVFIVKESEAISYSYERDTEDPRISHSFNIKFDEYGHVLESAQLVYPRLIKDVSLPLETQEDQKKLWITYSKNGFTNDIDTDKAYRIRLPAESMTYELKGVSKQGFYYSLSDFENILSVAGEVEYHQVDKSPATGTTQKRLIEHVRTIYRSDNLKDALPLYRMDSLAIPFESYQLTYTTSLIDHLFGAKVNEDLMLEGKFTHIGSDNSWWIRSGETQFIHAGEAIAAARNRFYLPVSYTDPYGAITKVTYDNNYGFYIEETEDALGNRVRVELYNFRTLSPQRMKDPNLNLSETITDELGMVKAMAVFGKGDEADDLIGFNEYSSAAEEQSILDFFHFPVENAKQLLQHATVRYVYDFDAYRKSGKPVVAASLTREEHDKKNNNSPIQIGFEYSNGLGQVVMKKAQAEPGLAKQAVIAPDGTCVVSNVDTSAFNPKRMRWIGNGRTVLNNKGNAVKQYEPYFSVTHHYEDLKELVETGVTPVMYYDAPGRLIKTEMPDGTLTRTVFDSWKQASYDQNDTILESEWYDKRANRRIDADLLADGKDPVREKAAADKSAKHAGTPHVQHLDTLGRPVLAIDHNKHVTADENEFYFTRAELDIEGNLRKIVDARGNTVMLFEYDMLGNKVYQRSMDAGQRWLLINIMGNPLRTWDERDHEFQYSYDILHRPVLSKVIGGDNGNPLNHIFDRIFYGETENNPELNNLRGQVVRHYDTGGILISNAYDFKGKPISITRKLHKDYKSIVNWTDANLTMDLESDSYTYSTEMDAIGRITKQTAPDGSLILPTYNEAGLLNGESVVHPGNAMATAYIKDIVYNEKGQQNKIVYGNDVVTRFDYDKETFRLKRLETKRLNNEPLQNWRYTYDPSGNITHIEDANIPTSFFDNQKITAVNTYQYDSLYRLVEATGRENTALVSFDSSDNWSDIAFLQRLNPGDPMAMRNYSQSYLYDAVGNIVQMRHQATGNSWTRDYRYQAANNRLIRTQVGGTTYSYAHHTRHGYMTAMPHLEETGWNFKEELVRTIRQRRTDGGTPETTYYQYDGQGQRIRKITENQANKGDSPSKKDERIYIAGYELYKQHSGTDAGLERVSLSLMDKNNRLAMIDTETKPRVIMGIPVGRTSPDRTVRYQLHDHLGSASLELDETAKVISYEQYHPFGTTAYQTKNASIKCAAKRYRYTGMERDEESGMYYHGARYYSPWLGRWMSCDPIVLQDSTNLYIYGHNNPLRYTDPDGMTARDLVASHLSKMEQTYSKVNIKVKAEVGDIAIYAKQGASRYLDPILRRVRLTESEHPIAGAAVKYLNPAYVYRNAKTIVIDRAVAVAKTVGDLRLIKAVKRGKMGAVEFVSRSKSNFVKALATRWAQTGGSSAASLVKEARQAAQVTDEAAREALPALKLLNFSGSKNAIGVSTAGAMNSAGRIGQQGATTPGVMKGVAGTGINIFFGVLALKELQVNLKNKDYAGAIASGAEVASSGTSIVARGASLVTGVSSASIPYTATVGTMSAAEGVAAAPHVAGAFALGTFAGVGIEKYYPGYTKHTADVGSRIEKATGSIIAGGVSTVVTTIPLFWAATKVYDHLTH